MGNIVSEKIMRSIIVKHCAPKVLQGQRGRSTLEAVVLQQKTTVLVWEYRRRLNNMLGFLYVVFEASEYLMYF